MDWPTIIASGVVALIVVIIGYFIEYRFGIFAGRKKELSYMFVSVTRLATLSSQAESRVTILFDGEPVSDVTSLSLGFGNTGQASIAPKDYITPVRFIFGEGVTILEEPSILKSSPSDLDISLFLAQNDTIQIKPTLLNKGDFIIFSLFLTGYRDELIEELKVEGRIDGVNEIKQWKAKGRQRLAILAISISFVIIFGTIILQELAAEENTPFICGGGFLAAMLVVYGSTYLQSYLERKEPFSLV